MRSDGRRFLELSEKRWMTQADQLEQLHQKIHRLESRSRWQSGLLVVALLLSAFVGCNSSGETVLKSPTGERLLKLSAEGLYFTTKEGKVLGELTPDKLRLSGPQNRTLQLQTDSVSAGLTIMSEDQVRVTLWSDGKESQMSFHEGAGARRASLSVDDKSGVLFLSEANDASEISLMCVEGKALVVKSPK